MPIINLKYTQVLATGGQCRAVTGTIVVRINTAEAFAPAQRSTFGAQTIH
jgi:hypothetical protein